MTENNINEKNLAAVRKRVELPIEIIARLVRNDEKQPHLINGHPRRPRTALPRTSAGISAVT